VTAASLLDEIRAALDDDGPRLVYADELMGQGDPRGEFIAVQCQLARLGYARRAERYDWIGDALIDPDAIDQDQVRKLRAREVALLDDNGEGWSAHAKRVAYYGKYRFERGFVAAITATAGDRRVLATLLDAVPMLVELELLAPGEPPPVFPALRQLRTLATELVAPMPEMPMLRRLALHTNVLDARQLLGWPAFAQLHAFHASVRLPGDDLARVLAVPRALDELQLPNSQLTADHVAALACAPRRVLGLLGNRLGVDGARALASSPQLAGLRALDLRRNAIGVSGAGAIGAAFAELRTLDLTGNSLGAPGIAALVAGGGLGKLRELCLQHTQLDDAAVAALAASPLLGRVRILSLRSNKITDRGARALAQATQLQQINLNNNAVSAKAKKALAAATGARVLA
jgi:uncharacterized protein (TIGR02996 family)